MNPMNEYKTVKILLHCPLCAADRLVDCPAGLWQGDRLVAICNQCTQRQDAEDKKAHSVDVGKTLTTEERLAIQWRKYCPTEFRLKKDGGKTELKRLTQAVAKCIHGGVVTDDFLPSSLVLFGETGAMKTRVAWQIVRHYFFADKTLEVFSCARFATAFQSAAGAYRADSFLQQITSADLLFVDDLGKIPWTVNVWGAFFEVVDSRLNWDKPMIITSNFDIPTLGKCLSQHVAMEVRGMAKPMCKRLTTGFKVIELPAQP